MTKTNGSALINDWSALTHWAEETSGIPAVRVQVRLRGNHLHLLWEAPQCPDKEALVPRFSVALAQTPWESLLPANSPPVYQMFLCGRTQGHRRPDWTIRLDCHAAWVEPQPPEEEAESPADPMALETPELVIASEPLPAHPPLVGVALGEGQPAESAPEVPSQSPIATSRRYLQALLNQTPLTDIPDLSDEALTLSYERLARRGYPEAIASYLSEILSSLGVAVKVSIAHRQSVEPEKSPWEKFSPVTDETPHRLWVLCESAYSPDPSLLAPVITQRLRDLNLENFRDALIVLQVRGETIPDWMLRIDLTPPSLILKEWARWGEMTALERFLNQELTRLQLHVRATLKESTLHLFCHPLGGNLDQVPDQGETLQVIQSLLNTISPQGIQAAAVYGVTLADAQQQREVPAWINWLHLPATQSPHLAPDVKTLALQGNLSALSFLLDRLINPNLDTKLSTGGIRVLVLPKSELLHIMTEAPICPSQSQVGVPIAQYLKKLRIPGVKGVRVYGRRAGQKQPLWRYGLDFTNLKPSVPEPTPEFVTTGIGEDELLATAGTLVLRPDVRATNGQIALRRTRPKPTRKGKRLQHLTTSLQQTLICSRLFVPQQPENTGELRVKALPGTVSLGQQSWLQLQKITTATAGIFVGTFFAVQLDTQLGQWLQQQPDLGTECTEITCDSAATNAEITAPPTTQGPREARRDVEVPGKGSNSLMPPLAEIWQEPATAEDTSVFNPSGFTETLAAESPCPSGAEGCESPEFNYPSFRNEQLDQQLVRYQQYIHRWKRPPDILIVGSSRALRGIDPHILEQELAKQGYPGLKVYNFGVNGATAQVVSLIVRQVLPPEQLPKLILFADGVRAINSGRVDLTFNAMESSEAYQALQAGTFKIETPGKDSNAVLTGPWWQSWVQQYHTLSQTWKQTLNDLSQTYPQREQLKTILLSGISSDSAATFPVPSDRAKLEKQQGHSGAPQNRSEIAMRLQSAITAVHQEIQGSEFLPSAENELSQFHANGFLAISERFDPETYYGKYIQVTGDYDKDYASFQLGGKQTTALKDLVEFTQTHDIEVVFVNMPLTENYLDPVRSNYEQEFEAYMRDLDLVLTGFTFRNLNDLGSNTPENFSDPSHLNRYGAIAVSQQLAKDRLIPWSKGLTERKHH